MIDFGTKNGTVARMEWVKNVFNSFQSWAPAAS